MCSLVMNEKQRVTYHTNYIKRKLSADRATYDEMRTRGEKISVLIKPVHTLYSPSRP